MLFRYLYLSPFPLVAAGVQFVTQPRTEPYGRLAVFVDLAGNKWDLLGEA